MAGRAAVVREGVTFVPDDMTYRRSDMAGDTYHKPLSSEDHAALIARSNALMIEALAMLDACDHPAAAYLDNAIVLIGLRPDDEGYPSSSSLA